jgi:hypothetical protein
VCLCVCVCVCDTVCAQVKLDPKGSAWEADV